MSARRLFMESFKHLTPAQLQSVLLWDNVGSGIVATTGAFDGGVTGTAGATTAQNSLTTSALNPTSATVGSHGFALKCPTALPASEAMVWELVDDLGTTLLSLTIKTDGKVALYRGQFGGGGVALGTSSAAFVSTTAFRYLQVGYTLTGSDTAEVRSTILSSTTSTLLIPSIGLSSPRGWMRAKFYLTEHIILSDYYVNDGPSSGGPFFSGETEIKDIVPTAVTTHTYYFPWTANSGSDLVAPVDDVTQDGDSTYDYTRQSYSTIQFQMEAITDDGRTVDDVLIVAVERATGSTWLPAPSFSWTRWDGIVGSGAFPNTILSTDYRAFLVMLKAHGTLGGLDWSITRVNDSRFGVRS